MSEAPAGLRRAVGDRSVLPTTLSVRFLVLFVLILASTASIYGYLGLRLGRAGETRVAGCLAGSALDEMRRFQPENMSRLIGSTTPVVTCVAPDVNLIVWSSVAGLLLVVVTTFVGYALAAPWRLRVRRRLLKPLAAYDPAAAAEVDRLVARYGLTRPPVALVAPLGHASHVYGTARRPLLCLAGATVRARGRDPERFTAIVLHELAHLRNRDTRPTLLATTAWRSFLVLAIVPYMALLAADVSGLRPRQIVFRGDDLHTTLAIAAMIALVLLTRLAVLRDRELSADGTAGRYDDGVLARHLRRPGLEPPARRPVVLRMHPTVEQRRRAAAEPWNLPSLSIWQLAGAGFGLSVLCQDAGTFAWQAALAAGFDPVPSGGTTYLLIAMVAVADIGPIGALAWLVEAVTWRHRVRELVAPARSPVLALAVGLGAGMILGEPGAVSAANASHWGVFDGVGDGSAGTAVVSALMLVGILAALSRWSWDNAGAWLPSVRGSLRRVSRWSAVAGTVAILPWYATWWSMHDEPVMGRAYLWTPGFAEALSFRYVPLPGAEWLQITYVPWDYLGWAPGVVVVTALPLFVTIAGLLRHRTPATPRWLAKADPELAFRPPDHRPPLGRAILIGAAGCALVLGAGTALARAAHAQLADSDLLNGADRVNYLHYLIATAAVLTTAVAAVAAAVATLSHRSRSVVFGLVAGLMVACVGGVAAPVLVGVARCGVLDQRACLGDHLGSDYRLFFGLAGTAQPVKAIVAGLIVAGLAAAVRRRSPAADRRPAGRPATVLIASGAASAVVLLAAAAWFNGSW